MGRTKTCGHDSWSTLTERGSIRNGSGVRPLFIVEKKSRDGDVNLVFNMQTGKKITDCSGNKGGQKSTGIKL